MNPDNTELWRSQIEATLKAAMAAPGANAPVPFTAGLLAALLGMNAKAANLGVAFAQEALEQILQKLPAAPAAFDPLTLVDAIGAAVDKGLDARLASLRAELLAELKR